MDPVEPILGRLTMRQLDKMYYLALSELEEERFRAKVDEMKEQLRNPPVPLWRRICRRVGTWLCSM